MKIILYTTHCPMCNMLTKKLDAHNIHYEVCEDVTAMKEKGFKSAPMLEVDGKILTLRDALKWLEEQK